MNSELVFNQIQKIADQSGKNDKIRLLREGMEASEHFERVLIACYDPMVTYGKVLDATDKTMVGVGTETFDSESTLDMAWDALEAMRTRLVSGNAANHLVSTLALHLNEPSFELFRRIVNKDMRAGFTESSINKAKPNTIDRFRPMLADKFKPEKVKYPVAAEIKHDGIRMLVVYENGKGTAFSREGHHLPAVQHIADDVATNLNNLSMEADVRANITDQLHVHPAGLVIDGEIATGEFNYTVSKARKHGEAFVDAVYHVFDVIPLADFKSDTKTEDQPYSYRRTILEGMFKDRSVDNVRVTDQIIASNEGELLGFNEIVQFSGGEGIIIKNITGEYHPRRNADWMKIKACETIDLMVVDTFEGEKKYQGKLGGLIVKHGDISVRVGGGFTDAQRDEFWSAPPIGKVIEIQYHEVTPDGSLRHPVFKGVRFDKSVSDKPFQL